MLAAMALAAVWAASAPAAHDRVTLVVCAPGYPGSTEEAQPTMDGFANALAAAADWPAGELAATYFESEAGGLERMQRSDAALALVPLAFFLQHAPALKLAPRLQAVQVGGTAAESWTLIAGKGKVTRASDLAGWEIISLAGYVPGFVRGVALADWGPVPADVRIDFSGAVLSALRRAAAGERVALLLDRTQAAAVATLPFAAQLEVVARSAPVPVAVLCVVANRLPDARVRVLASALRRLGDTPAGAEALASVRLSAFVPVDQAALARAQTAFRRATP
jgi:hypothetical protein